MDSRVLITGGTAGIGLATAFALSEKGHSVFICGRDEEKLQTAIAKLEGVGPDRRISGAVCDVRNYDDVSHMINAATKAMGGLDALVNNAGVGSVESIETLSPEDWRAMIDINLTGVFNCCKAALPALKKSAKANIINLGSRAGRYAFAGGTGYNATKFGLQGFSEALFLDLGKYGIGVSLVAPGAVATGFAGMEDETWHLLPEDVAKVIADILSNDKRANVNWVEIRPGLKQ
ncbi:MAG: SDR family NAD(P)-dependent oxidoreductase [Proteobacteria bacterium]|nr:SDR family NAD(P)-dependent oxidoreductase [Pseudomonadota bacterium]